ncbi:hypothetical protein J7T55_002760 [Diaporthe amygdali]|uniref:uncharacterized protein n=1 Tax=Phomopsis amygdali TaxID=1214568 RepID=UPI0022FE69F0|nr:uncharacterized protein J7T55_002760 [Diaporthe amygdali]KAJ0122248.1 hypothetical protein J7T55_002760 [Diaporthe amygdali]
MRKQKTDGQLKSGDKSLLRTCQVCSHAKLRCDRTQNSGFCDRCLRLNKTCIFPPARRGTAPAQRVNRINQLEAKIAKLDNILASQQVESGGSEASPVSGRDVSRSSSAAAGETADEASRIQHANGVSLDPFQLGLLSIETGELLLDRFRRSLSPYFPFVVIPQSAKVADLHREKPIVCLAVLFAASIDDRALQARIARLFEQMLATALLQGSISTLENLQGLLIYISWAQYQPRPRKHTQNMFLAMSIIYDLRFHKPRYLSTRVLAHDPGAATGVLRADEIVDLLRMIEDIESLVKGTTHFQLEDNLLARIENLQRQLRSLKEALPPNLASSPLLKLQIHAAELLLGELALPGSPVGLSLDPSTSLAESISAVKSLMEIFLSAEPGQETCFTNVAWIMFGYGLSLGVRLDILCTTCGISATRATELRGSLGMPQILKGVVERLRTSVPQNIDTDAEAHPFCPFLSRAEAVESWYVRHGPPAPPECAPVVNQPCPQTLVRTQQDDHRRNALSSHPHPDMDVEGFFGTTNNQDSDFAFDPEMLAFEGLDFADMDFAMDHQEAWNPFVFPDGAY